MINSFLELILNMDTEKYYQLSLNFKDCADQDDLKYTYGEGHRILCCARDVCNGNNVCEIIGISKDVNKLKNLAKIFNSISIYDPDEYEDMIDKNYKEAYEIEDEMNEYNYIDYFEYLMKYAYDYDTDEWLKSLFWPKVFKEWEKNDFKPKDTFTHYRTCHQTYVNAEVKEVMYIK